MTMYHYTESGLQNVWLANGFKIKKTDGGKAVAIMDAEGLHQAIGRMIACKTYLTGGEIRFLRKELGLSQQAFAALAGNSVESVSLWERRGRVPKHGSRLMQALYLEAVDGNVKLKELLERLADIDRKHLDRIVFEDTKTGWREAA
jgi:DNA-binding transcriptional regulator YiaG